MRVWPRRRSRVTATGGLALCALILFGANAVAAPTVTEFSKNLTPNSTLEEIAAGPDGNLWFTEDAGRIGRITPAGAITEYGHAQGLSLNGGPQGIVAGPDGNVWFAESNNPGRIGKITPSGVITEYTGGVTPNFTVNSGPQEITVGPDGNLWFTEAHDPGAIAKITPSGTVTEFKGGVASGFTANQTPNGITKGPDGNTWFTEIANPGAIGRITPTGKVTEFTTALSTNSQPLEIAPGSDGNLWFTEFNDPGRIGRITPTGTINEFTGGVTPRFTANVDPSYIVTGPDGNLWFSEYGGSIARITPSGHVDEFPSALTGGGGPYGITVGPDGNLWFVEFNDPGAIARMTTPPAAVTGRASVLGAGAASVTGTVNGHAQATSYRFEYGRTSAYGTVTTPFGAGSGYATVPASRVLKGLSPNTKYHYRLNATNPTGTIHGADRTFITLPLPRVSAPKLTRKTWRLGNKLVQISTKRPPVGTTISFKLNRAARTKLEFFTVKSGRIVSGKCGAPKPTNDLAKKCTRLRRAGKIAFLGHSGRNAVRFQGRVSKHKTLKPGRYQAKITASDPTDPVPSTRTLRFTIVQG